MDMGQSRGRRAWKYTMRSLSEELGIPLRTLKLHRQKGWFNPDSHASVMLYGSSVISGRLASEYGEVVRNGDEKNVRAQE